ncbi:MAG: hypothetical protein AAFW67_02080, partial [Cyanobacteria bacterium J06638_38]
MTHNSLPPQLYLLIPGDLPIDEQLSSSNQIKISQILQNLLQALNELSNHQALTIINRELADLDLSNICPSPIPSTQTSLKPWEVEDFNQCFKLSHVATEDKCICLVWGLLTVYKTLLVLERDNPKFNPSRVKDLKEGLKSHVYLLGRVFNLSLRG